MKQAMLHKRILAYFIDMIIFYAVATAITSFFTDSNTMSYTIDLMYGIAFTMDLIVVLTAISYFMLCDFVLNGSSLGKRIFNLKVVTLNNDVPSAITIIIRNVTKVMLSLLTLVSLITVISTKKCLALHDLVSNTYVVEQ